MGRTRYAIVGTGLRASIFIDAIVDEFRDVAQLVAMCDNCQARMDVYNRRIGTAVPTFVAEQFDPMIRETKPNVVIVTSPDHTHDQYIIRAMQLGCDVICEKPMATDAAKVRAIFEAIEKTGRSLRVAFNFRYAPHVSKVRELLQGGSIGTPLAVDFSYLLDTDHGADYFRRWHARKEQSGGLLVHKSTHHFDLVNWWLGSFPQTVFAMGGLKFYGEPNSQNRNQRFSIRPESFDVLQRDLYFGKALAESSYARNADVFGKQVTIEDTLAVLCRYRSGAILNYSLNCYSPWEGFRVAITGTKGRIELFDRMNPSPTQQLTLLPMFGQAQDVPLPAIEGVHGGADPLILRQLFRADPSKRDASHIDGAASVLLGIAGNESIRTGRSIDVDELLKLP